jgi:hypothetical protein
MRKDGARVAFEFEAAGYARLCARQVLGREHGQAQILYARGRPVWRKATSSRQPGLGPLGARSSQFNRPFFRASSSFANKRCAKS